MTYLIECTQLDLAMELLIKNGFDAIADAVDLLMNTWKLPTPQARHRTTPDAFN